MPYNDQIVDQVQTLNDIVEIISGYIPLKRAGRNFKANCPFHQEKTPSFMVNPDKQIFHCFGCSAGGDVFSFLMKYEQLTFPEALQRLAERVHVALPETKQTPSIERSLIERLHQIYAFAVEFYRANLKHPELGKAARAYLEKRGFSVSEMEQFGVGLSLPDWKTLYQHLSKKGFKDDELYKSGLILRSSQGTPYDLFRSRVMFPIFNRQGKPIAMGGRIMTDELPKYINSPENPIFRKRKELYGLNWAARVAHEDVRRMIIVEGYLGLIRLHLNGFQNTVATLGTSLTAEHVQVLKRYADEAIVLFDGDKAGEAASLRGLDIFLEEGMSVKVLCLPKGYDPDDFIKAKGADAMKELLTKAQDVFDFKLQVLLGRFNKSDSLGLLKITSEFLDTFAKIKTPVLVDRYLKRLAMTLGVEESSLRSELNKLKSRQGALRDPAAQVRETSAIKRGGSAAQFGGKKQEPPAEKLLLALSLHFPPYFRTFFEEFPEYVFSGEKTKELARVFSRFLEEYDDRELSTSKLLNRIPNDQLKAFASELLIMEWNSDDDRDHAFYDLIENFKNQKRTSQLQFLRNQISQAEESGDQELVLKYMKAYQDLLADLKS